MTELDTALQEVYGSEEDTGKINKFYLRFLQSELYLPVSLQAGNLEEPFIPTCLSLFTMTTNKSPSFLASLKRLMCPVWIGLKYPDVIITFIFYVLNIELLFPKVKLNVIFIRNIRLIKF